MDPVNLRSIVEETNSLFDHDWIINSYVLPEFRLIISPGKLIYLKWIQHAVTPGYLYLYLFTIYLWEKIVFDIRKIPDVTVVFLQLCWNKP